jgi:Cu-Zn family superoxide dismutase
MVLDRLRTCALIVTLAGFGLSTAPLAAQEATPVATPEVGGAPSPRDEMLVTLIDTQSQEIGTASLVELPDGSLSITVNATLEPGDHGIHIHETGVCDPGGDEPFASAGGHYNPGGARHGGPPQASPTAADANLASPVGEQSGHAGDLGNITAGDDGTAILIVTTNRTDLTGLADEDGSALVIHANPDDLATDPSGNSGGRVACGVIFAPRDGAPAAEASPAAS